LVDWLVVKDVWVFISVSLSFVVVFCVGGLDDELVLFAMVRVCGYFVMDVSGCLVLVCIVDLDVGSVWGELIDFINFDVVCWYIGVLVEWMWRECIFGWLVFGGDELFVIACFSYGDVLIEYNVWFWCWLVVIC